MDIFLLSSVLTNVGFIMLAMATGSLLGNSCLFQIIYASGIGVVLIAIKHWIWNPKSGRVHRWVVGRTLLRNKKIHS